MSESVRKEKPDRSLLKVLTAHYHSLVSAGGDVSILREYSELLRFLRSGRYNPTARQRTDHEREPRTTQRLDRQHLENASLDALESLVKDESVSRKELEFIAIERFSVPRGSMRSFSNRDLLVEKLLTLIRTERTHETIRAVAHDQGKRPSEL
jgi:hypothetical protein